MSNIDGIRKGSSLHSLHKVVDRSLQVFVGLSLAVLVVLTFGQFVGRYVFWPIVSVG